MVNTDLIGYGPRRGLSVNPVLNAQYARGQIEGQDLNNQSGAMQLMQAQKAADLEQAMDPALREEALRLMGGGQGDVTPGTMTSAAPGPSPMTPAPVPARPRVLTGQVLPPISSGGRGRPSQNAPGITAAPGGGNGSLVGSLARIPGAGRTAWGIAQQQQQAQAAQKSAYLDKVFEAFGKGELPLAKAYSDAIGVTWPDEVWSDARAQRALGEASKWKALYGTDLTTFGKAMQYAMKTAEARGGSPDWQGAFQMFPPRRQATAAETLAGQGSMQMRDAKILMASHPGMTLEQAYTQVRQGGVRPPTTPGNVQLYEKLHAQYLLAHPGDEAGFLDWYAARGGRAGGGAGKVSAELQKVEWVQRTIPQFKNDPRGAWAFAHQAVQNPALAIKGIFDSLTKSQNDDLTGLQLSDKERWNRAKELYHEFTDVAATADEAGMGAPGPSPATQLEANPDLGASPDEGGADLSGYSDSDLMQMLQQGQE